MTSSTTSDSGVVKSGLQNYNKKRSVYVFKIRDKPTEFKNSIVHRRTLFVQYFTSTAFTPISAGSLNFSRLMCGAYLSKYGMYKAVENSLTSGWKKISGPKNRS